MEASFSEPHSDFSALQAINVNIFVLTARNKHLSVSVEERGGRP